MRLLKFTNRTVEPGILITERLLLRRPEMGDYDAWATLRGESADFLKPFEPSWTRDELTRSAFRLRLRRQEAEINSGRGLPWFLFDRKSGERLVGGLTLSHIRRGVSQAAALGYWMGRPYAGRGYMKEAVETVCRSAFQDHNLHRIEAATVIENQRSQRLLRSCGFQQEGLARGYLKICGEWRDHLLFARLMHDQSDGG